MRLKLWRNQSPVFFQPLNCFSTRSRLRVREREEKQWRGFFEIEFLLKLKRTLFLACNVISFSLVKDGINFDFPFEINIQVYTSVIDFLSLIVLLFNLREKQCESILLEIETRFFHVG